jgi:hypothetical protein
VLLKRPKECQWQMQVRWYPDEATIVQIDADALEHEIGVVADAHDAALIHEG